MAKFQPAVDMVIHHEGGLNEKSAAHDPGGLTNYGISYRFLREVKTDNLRKYGLPLEITEEVIRTLTRQQAENIYRGEFWEFFRFAEIEDQLLANYVFDCAINPNPATGFKCLQRAIWVYAGYEKCKDDGIMGSKTLALANTYGRCLIRPMMSERAGWYRQNTNDKFIDGWLRRAYSEPF